MRLLDAFGPTAFYVIMAVFAGAVVYALFADTFTLLYGVAWLFIPALVVAVLSAPYYLWKRFR